MRAFKHFSMYRKIFSKIQKPNLFEGNVHYSLSSPGAGAGKGGGAGGAIKEGGGGLGRYGAAQEEGYFHKRTNEQLRKLKKQLESEEKLKQTPDEKK